MRHAVKALVAQHQAAPAGAVLVGVGAVGVQRISERVGQCGELFGPVVAGVGGQFGFDLLAGGGIDPARQLVEKPPDHRHLPGPEGADFLRGGGGRQHRRQRFAGQSVAWSQVGGLVDAPGGFGAADQCRLGDRVGEFSAQFFGGGLAGNGIDQRVLGGRDPAAQPLETLQQRQLFTGAQRLAIKLEHPLKRGIHGIKSRRQRLSINTTASHNPKLSGGTDKKRHSETTETKVTQVI